VKTTIATALGLFLVATRVDPSWAGPLADALTRHSDKDVETLRAQRSEVAARCTLGAVYAKRSDVSRAALYLADCGDATLPDDVSAEIGKIDRDLHKKLRDSDYAVLEVVTHPDVMTGEIDALPGDTFATPATLYLSPGHYTVHASKDGSTVSNEVTTTKRSRAIVILDARRKETGAGAASRHPAAGSLSGVGAGAASRHPAAGSLSGAGSAKDTTVDFSQDNASEQQQAGPPPDVKRGTLLPKRYRGGGVATAAVPANPNAIDDPLETREEAVHVDRGYWLGFRLGGGVFDDGAPSARAGVALAATARFTLTGNLFAAGRVDWSRRGGDWGMYGGDSGVDVLGASAGIGMTVVDRNNLGLALIAQLRGDLRLASSITLGRTSDTMTSEDIGRTGAGVAIGAELALPRTPFTAGVRFEQGLTKLGGNARDRAVLLELGVDWR